MEFKFLAIIQSSVQAIIFSSRFWVLTPQLCTGLTNLKSPPAPSLCPTAAGLLAGFSNNIQEYQDGFYKTLHTFKSQSYLAQRSLDIISAVKLSNEIVFYVEIFYFYHSDHSQLPVGKSLKIQQIRNYFFGKSPPCLVLHT